ncbi:site-specific DNA-methyltransferase [Candidatus Dojkabacteria bacterium]|uniref:Site-specific DNA-methyltransferase n=1 Tax=Candidatus Dojkabacteria bacterium TaxID=2099670 RepID=A0A5C7J3M1_9BACT|nr:MAG: site-specific DNA-methyltransferase [Candidatus Dojkabacteria bacterium]
MPKPVSPHKKKDIEQYKHKDKTRLNNPQVGMVSHANDPDSAIKRYSYDPHLDPTLVWTGKKEQSELNIDTVSIHVHERIDPKTIVQQVHKHNVKGYQHSLFEEPFDHRPVRDEVSFYQHKNAWANRLVAGDSLLVMNSLLEKEGMAGQVQMVFIDPPYGIKYGSNFQPYTDKRNVQDGKDEDLSTEPEMIKAFRDTWELGIHSYLSYMRNRLMLAKELLNETGSCFVQISDQNIHHIRELMDEIFGAENFFSLITFKKTLPLGSSGLAGISDYLIWYAKDKKQMKYRQLYTQKELGSGTGYTWVELPDGKRRKMTAAERQDPATLPNGSRPFFADNLMSSGYTPSCFYDFEFEGKQYKSQKYSWKTNKTGMQTLIEQKRIIAPGNLPNYVRFFDDFPVQELHNLWDDTHGASNPVYVVQTSNKVLQRCILMCTDPGDLVLDPTCGSGTTAYVAEQWGRRWITVDTSRVAIQLAKQRILTSVYDWYKLAHPDEGVSGGFD